MKKLGRRMVARLMAGVLTVSLGLAPVDTVKAEEIRSEDMLEAITADHGEGVSEDEKTDALQDEAASVSENEAIGGDENEEDNEPEDESVKEESDGDSAEAEEQEESQTDSMTEGEKPAESSEEDKEAENDGENDVESDMSVEQQEAVRTAGTVAQAADIISGTDWTLDAAGKLTIWSDAGMKDWVDSGQADYNEKIISAEIQNGVTSIEEYAFSSCSSLASITIPSSVARIGGYAFFQCSSLTSVTIQAGVESIGNDAFSGCSSLVSIELPLGVTDIGAGAFQDCNDLTDIILPTSVTDIGDGVFRRCRSLTNIEIPPGVTNIGGGVFSDCSSLTSITLPVGLTSIGAWIFNGCSSLTDITLPANVTSIGSGAFSGCSSLTSIMLPISVTSIENNAFSDCGSLTNITLPTDMTNIGNSAFSGCSSLTRITIPTGVTSIGSSAFQGCSKLETVLMQGTTPSMLGEDAFKGSKFVTDNTRGIEVPLGTGATYRDSWKRWAEYITDGGPLASGPDWTLGLDGKLTIRSDEGMEDWRKVRRVEIKEQVVSVELLDGVTSIGDYAFQDCSSLASITIPTSVTSIGGYAFHSCINLASITIPPDVTSIGDYAFFSCHRLRNITLPLGVTSIGDYVFYACSSLTSIALSSGVTSIGTGAFGGCGCLASITLPTGVTDIEEGAFWGCSSLTSITLPTDVTSIGSSAFRECNKLESVTMQGTTPPALAIDVFDGCKFVIEYKQGIKVPWGAAETYKKVWKEWARHITDDSLLVSGVDWMFDLDGKLTIWSDEGMKDWQNAGKENHIEKIASVELQDGVTSIGSNIFSGCSNLISITIPSGVTDIGTSAFQDCSSLTSITIPAGVASIEYSTFGGCSKLTSITLPTSVTSIGDFAFYNCNGLTSITIPAGVTSIGGQAFDGCSSLTSITIPAGVASIEYSTFGGCSKLTSITLPSSVTSIEGLAFSCCSSLESITLPVDITSIGNYAFLGCSSLESITLPTGITSIECSVFLGCSRLTSITLPDSVTSIGDFAFGDCSSLSSIELPDGVTSIGDFAFGGCSLSSIELPVSVTHIGANAFNGCSSLERVTMQGTTTPVLGIADEDTGETKVFNSCKFVIDKTEGIKVPSGTAEAYKAAWPEWADYITDGSVPTDGKEKVKAVKQAVEVAVKNAIDKALAGTKVTNDNAEETAAKIETLIPDAVAEAMAETGISTDEVEVGEAGIEIKPAGDSEGSIQITIHITSKEDAEQSDSAVVQVPIVTSEGDIDLTKDAQKMVEDALKKITVTNETTREDILDALKKELYNEVTVESIEKFNKVEATKEAPGSISLSIRITRDGQTAVINTSVLIAQLGKKTGVYIRFTDYYELDGSIPCYKYTGAAVKPTVEVYNNETMLIPGADYTIAYKNNIKVGSTAALTVKGKGNFSGTSNVVKFKIINADIERDTVHPTEMTVVVNTKVAPTIMNGTKKLTTKDYRLEGTGISNSKYAVATAEGNPNILTVKGIGSYEGSSFDIRVRVIEKSAAKKLAVVVARDFKPVYNGMTINMSSLINNTQGTEGVITVTDAKDRTKILKEGTDFAVLCSSNLLCAGTVKFTITGMGEYTGSVSRSFKINPLRITDSSRFSVSFDERKAYEYKASGTTVDNLLVTYLGETGSVEDDKILTEGVDYKVTYSNHKKVSGAKNAGLKITFLGNYKGSSAVSRTFKIVTAKMSAANTEVTVPDKVYSKANRAYKSTPIVTVDGVAIKASNYTVSYAWATGSEAADNTKYISDNKVKITIAEGDIWAKVKVTITPKQTSNYALDKGAVLTGEYYVRKADNAVNLSKAKVTFLDKNAIQLKSLEYNGNPFYTPAGNNMEANNAAEDPNAVYLRVSVNGGVVDPDLYDVIWTNATEKGRATVVIRGKGIDTGKGIAVGSKNQSVNIKAMALKGKTPQSLMENTKNAISNLMSIF